MQKVFLYKYVCIILTIDYIVLSYKSDVFSQINSVYSFSIEIFYKHISNINKAMNLLMGCLREKIADINIIY